MRKTTLLLITLYLIVITSNAALLFFGLRLTEGIPASLALYAAYVAVMGLAVWVIERLAPMSEQPSHTYGYACVPAELPHNSLILVKGSRDRRTFAAPHGVSVSYAAGTNDPTHPGVLNITINPSTSKG